MKRRNFIKNTAAISAGIMVSADGLAPKSVLAENAINEKHPVVSIAGSNDTSFPNPVALDVPLDYKKIKEIVWLALDRDNSQKNLVRTIKNNSWVVIKPNIVAFLGCGLDMDDTMHWGLVTDLRAVYAVIEYLIEKTAPARISIAEGPPWETSGGKLNKDVFVDGWHYEWEGMDNLSFVKIVEQANGNNKGIKVDIIDLNEDDPVYVTDFDPRGTAMGAFQDVKPGDPDGVSKDKWTKRKGIYLPKTIMDCDFLITMPVLKTHASAGVTLCIKNFVGCVHSQVYGDKNGKAKIHQGSQLGLIRGVADLGCAIDADYAVAEGFWATVQMHDAQNGVNINHNVVVVGSDIVATEAVCMLLMGFNPLDSDLLRMMNAKNMGEWNPDRINIEGPSYKTLKRNYERAENAYSSRGIRKWMITGPIKSPLADLKNIKPSITEKSDKDSWTLLDGDKIVDMVQNSTPPYRLQENLLYEIPGSLKAGKGSYYYLAVKLITERKDLCGQLLVGLRNADFKAILNGKEIVYQKKPLSYDPTPIPFIQIKEGENLLLLEIIKTVGGKEPIRIAVNVCDLDGDRLFDMKLNPADC